jgi:hypothetical protein
VLRIEAIGARRFAGTRGVIAQSERLLVGWPDLMAALAALRGKRPTRCCTLKPCSRDVLRPANGRDSMLDHEMPYRGA